ncbi:MAG TPA: TnsA endonuclease N-terminal domain-containing protein [Ktedonobacteraceae bacterium]
MKLSKEGFEQWCRRLGLSDQAKAVITQIRTLPPARHVQSSAGNVSGTYPSLKMECTIQFESHRNELPFVYLIDHDPDVVEFYDQPAGEIKLKYRNQDDTRNVTARHTPDFFVLREDGAGWVECKMEDDLVRLAKEKPFRYQQRPDGSLLSVEYNGSYTTLVNDEVTRRKSRAVSSTNGMHFPFLTVEVSPKLCMNPYNFAFPTHITAHVQI